MFQNKKPTLVEEEKNKGNIEVLTFLGMGTEFKGKVIFQGTLRIDGILEGEIEGSDTLILGESGSINGTCRVSKVIISGKLKGEIYAGEKVIIKKNADVNGKISAPSMLIEEGARFNGTCKMGRDFQSQELEEESPAESTPLIEV
jgi:cytoskeletal protein CcmA (bactofilin family)